MKSEPLTQQTEHNGQKPYKCSYYEKSFPFRYHLTVHEIMYTGEKPYQCSDCESALLEHAILKITRECTLAKKNI